MNDLEQRIVEVLSRDAPTFVRTMPRGTVGKVRVRQALTFFVTLSLVAGFAFGGFSILSVAPRASHEPGAWQTVAPPDGELPSPEGTAEGITDATAAPDPSGTAGEDTRATSVSSLYPYTDQVEGQELYLTTQKHVVAHGHVSGIEWSLAAFGTQLYTGNLFSPHLGGPCGDLFVGNMGDYGGIEFCLHTEETRPDAQFALAGFGNNSDPFAGPITGYAGLVGPQVSTVELRLADGTTSDLKLFDAPPRIDARYFATFLDEGTVGTIVAIGSGGNELDGGRLCVGDVPRAPDNIGCGHGLLGGPFSVVTTDP
jgi:hypothetical protein